MPVVQLADGGGTLSTLESNFLIAVIGTIVGSIGTLVVNYISSRKEPHKRVSWDATAEPGLKNIDPDIRRKLRIDYNGVLVEDLFSVKYRLQNTGNRVVKNERLRFTFPADAEIVEAYLSPEPEPELKVSEESVASTNERVYLIGQLERGQEVNFRFVATGKEAASWKAVPSNDEGDVVVEQRDAPRTQENAAHIAPFLIWTLLLFAAPSVIDLGDLFGGLLTGVTAFVCLVFAIYHLQFAARVIRDVLVSLSSRRTTSDVNAVARDGGKVLIVSEEGRINGSVSFESEQKV